MAAAHLASSVRGLKGPGIVGDTHEQHRLAYRCGRYHYRCVEVFGPLVGRREATGERLGEQTRFRRKNEIFNMVAESEGFELAKVVDVTEA